MMYILLHIYIHTLYSLHLYIYICFIYTYCACWCIFIFTATSSAHLNSCWRETIILCCRLNVFWIHSFTGGGASADRSCLVALAECYCESSMPMHNAHTRSYSDSWCVYDILWINRYKYLLYIYICRFVSHHITTPGHLLFKIHHAPGGQARLRPYFPWTS